MDGPHKTTYLGYLNPRYRRQPHWASEIHVGGVGDALVGT